MSGPGADAKPDDVVLESMAEPGVSIALTPQRLANGDYLLVPSSPLVDGNQYVVTDRGVCAMTGEHGPRVVFSVGPRAPLPSTLGALSVASSSIETMALASSSGSCFADAVVDQTTVELMSSTEAAPWVDVLHFTTLVDGKPWGYATSAGAQTAPGATPSGRGRDRVFRVCEAHDPGIGTPGLITGTHEVTMLATLPGTTQALASSALDVTVACEAPMMIDEPAGCSAGGPAATLWVALAGLALLGRRSRRRYRLYR